MPLQLPMRRNPGQGFVAGRGFGPLGLCIDVCKEGLRSSRSAPSNEPQQNSLAGASGQLALRLAATYRLQL